MMTIQDLIKKYSIELLDLEEGLVFADGDEIDEKYVASVQAQIYLCKQFLKDIQK